MSETGCQSCKEKKGIPAKQVGIIILGFYLLFSATYGTIQIVKNLIGLFK